MENFKTIPYDFKNSGYVVLLERSYFVPQKLGTKLLKIGKDMKIKHSVSSPPLQSIGELFSQKSFAWGNKHFGANLLGCFTWGIMIRSCKGGRLMVKRFQKLSRVIFPIIDLDLGYSHIIWKVNTANRGLNLKNTFCTLCLWGWNFM